MYLKPNNLSGYQSLIAFFVIIVLSSTQQAYANTQSHQSIYRNIQTFITTQYPKSKLSVSVGKLDARLKLPQCTNKLTSFWPQNHKATGNTTVGVRCDSHKPWKVYVPVKIMIFKKIAIARHPIKRGELLKQQDIGWEMRDISVLYQGYIEEIDQYIGQVTTRVINNREAIVPRALKPPRLIRRGENVILLAKKGRIEIRILGKALSDGGLGDIIKIRNQKSAKIVEGKVIARGMAQIHM